MDEIHQAFFVQDTHPVADADILVQDRVADDAVPADPDLAAPALASSAFSSRLS